MRLRETHAQAEMSRNVLGMLHGVTASCFVIVCIMARSSIAEGQWNSFCSSRFCFATDVSDWLGLWTFWDPHTGEVSRSFNCVRSFKALNEGKTVIKHQNISDQVKLLPEHKGPWEIRKEDTDENGFYHPAKPHTRAVLHANGSGVWAPREITDKETLSLEMFLCRREFRCSVVVSYNESKQLRSFGAIRENHANAQVEVWSRGTALRECFPHSDFNKDFVGVENTLDRNLQLSVQEGCKWAKDHWLGTKQMDESGNLLFKFLPDGICLSCPGQYTNSFSLRVCALFPNGDEKELQELEVSYVDGHVHSVKQGLYH